MKDRDLVSMEHRGIEYAVRARPGRNRWTWTIYPDSKSIKGNIEGNRLMAIAAACRAIDLLPIHHSTRQSQFDANARHLRPDDGNGVKNLSRMEFSERTGRTGTTVSITHTTFASELAAAARPPEICG